MRVSKYIIIVLIAILALFTGINCQTISTLKDEESSEITTKSTEDNVVPPTEATTEDDSISTISSENTLEPIIIDHTCTDITLIPQQWINEAKLNLRVWYAHTSHGSQITAGMKNLRLYYDSLYDFSDSIESGILSYQEVTGDLGHNGDLDWERTTRNQLNKLGNDRNIVMWSWCSGVSDNTKDGIDIYLNAMDQLEADYPNIIFIYMTGHLDGTGLSGNLNIHNNRIRDYCTTNNKILFDFADIESYDPDGNYFLDLYADDNCNYNDGNWAQEWCALNPNSELCWPTECAHSQAINCNLKGRAFWWMLARIAGWNGISTN
jgi:hypothetical protein